MNYPVCLLPLLFYGSLAAACHKGSAGPVSTDTIVNPLNPPVVTRPVPATDTIFGNGVNLQPSYYNGGNVTFGFDLMRASPKIRSVRIEIEPTVPIALAASWIQQARNNGYKVIATYHKYTVLGSDNAADLADAANWWKANYTTLAAAGSFTVNLMNEWGDHNITASAYASAYNNAISIVRTVYSGPMIIDIPGWGEETLTAMQAC